MLRRLCTLLACIAIALSLFACERADTGAEEGAAATAADTDETLALAITLATAVRESPDTAEAVLSEHDMTVEAFEALMFDIASDPELSTQFEAAME